MYRNTPKERNRQRKRPILAIEGSDGGLPYRRNHASAVLAIIFVIVSTSSTTAFSLSHHHKIGTSTLCRKEVPCTYSLIALSRSSNICVLYEGQHPDRDEIIQSAMPVEPPPSLQYVQQEQLLEVVSRIGADKIASLSISERTKRAMLAEAVEDEIFSCTEQIIDLVNEKLMHDSNNDSNQSELNTKQKNGIEVDILDLRERNQFLQAQYNDLVSGRPSSLLNTVNSVGGSTTFDGSISPIEIDNGQCKNDSDEADFTQFN